jgi:hypothetical protein
MGWHAGNWWGGVVSSGFSVTAGWGGISAGAKSATVAMSAEPVSVIAMPADSILGMTRHGPLFEF